MVVLTKKCIQISISVPGTFYKFMQVGGGGGLCNLFIEKEIAVLKFWNGDRGCLAPNTIKYKFLIGRRQKSTAMAVDE